jgi:4'-phosphopantetheinyl transferase EntD
MWDDPHRASAAWLFEPHPVIVEGIRMAADPPPVHPDEASEVATAVHRRRVEFATGRSCARRALARLRVPPFVLRNQPNRAPRWPSGVVGSITHTGTVPGGYCAVAVASARKVLTVGFDAETGESLSRDLWEQVLTPSEAGWLRGLAANRRPRMARLVFSAKEAFYKAQFPLTGQYLDFDDVEIAVDEASGTFEARLVRDDLIAAAPLRRCAGRYVDRADIVLTGVALPA